MIARHDLISTGERNVVVPPTTGVAAVPDDHYLEITLLGLEMLSSRRVMIGVAMLDYR